MPEDRPRFPGVMFPIPPTPGDGYVLVHRARAAMRRAGVPNAQCKEFVTDALRGDLEHRLATIKKWVYTS